MKKKPLKNILSEDDRILKEFLEEHIPFAELKKAGFFPKDMKKSDIHGQAARICKFFGYKTVFEYGTEEIQAHISYASGPAGLDSDRPKHVTPEGELGEAPFVETFGSWLDD